MARHYAVEAEAWIENEAWILWGRRWRLIEHEDTDAVGRASHVQEGE